MPGAIIRIDQDRPGPSTSTGTSGVARKDLWVGHAVRPTSTLTGNNNQQWTLLDKPTGSAAALTDAAAVACEFTPDLPGSYRIRLVTNDGGAANVQILIAAVTFDSAGALINNGWRVPAFGERVPENNFSGQARGWAEAIEKIVADLQDWYDGVFGQKNGVAIGQRQAINFVGDTEVEDDTVNGRLNVTPKFELQDEGAVQGAFNKLNVVGDLVTSSVMAGVGQIEVLSPVLVYDIVFATEVSSTDTTYAREGARKLDLTKYPATIGGLTRRIRFHAVLENSLHSANYYAEARLFDITNAVAVTGTALNNSGEANRAVPNELISADLAVGASAGNIRSDMAAVYGVQFRAVGTLAPPADRVILGAAALVISYE